MPSFVASTGTCTAVSGESPSRSTSAAAESGARTGPGCGAGGALRETHPARAMAARTIVWRRMPQLTAVAREIFRQPRVRVVARRADLPRRDALLHLALRLVQVRAVVEAARLRRLGEFGEVVAQRIE